MFECAHFLPMTASAALAAAAAASTAVETAALAGTLGLMEAVARAVLMSMPCMRFKCTARLLFSAAEKSHCEQANGRMRLCTALW